MASMRSIRRTGKPLAVDAAFPLPLAAGRHARASLEYLLSASEACHAPWLFSAKRVPYSAAASLSTLAFPRGRHQGGLQGHRHGRTDHGTEHLERRPPG